MTFLFIVIGAALGAMLSGFNGVLWGAALGWIVHRLLPLKAPAEADQAQAPARNDLSRRVAALEEEIRTLKAEVLRLSRGSIPPAAPVPSTLPEPDLTLEAAEAMPAPVPAAMPLAQPAEPEALVPVLVPAPVAEVPVPSLAEQPLPEPPFPVAEPPVPAQPPASSEPDSSAWPDDQAALAPSRRPRPGRPAEPSRDWKDRIPQRLHPFIFGGNTIVKVGVLILFLGLAFLLSYVAEQVTVSIEMRYAGVALLGAGLLGLGWRLRDKGDATGAPGYGLILQGAGVGIFYLTTLAAMKLHPLLPVAAGFAVMVLVTLFGTVLAVAQNAPWLAYVAAAAGFATPVLVSTGQGSHIALFSYLAILDLGIVAIAWFKAWRPLNLIGFLGTFTLAAAWAGERYAPGFYASTQAFLLLFFLMFTAISVLFARRALGLGDEPDEASPLSERARQALRQMGRVDSTLVFGVPLAAYGLQYQMVKHDEWLPALCALVLALFYVLLGGALWRGKARYALLGEAYVVVGVLFGTLSIPLALEGVWTGATWAVEAAGMYWLGTRQHRAYTRAFALAVLGGAAVRTLSSLGWDVDPGLPLIAGSRLGVAMLAGSALAVGLVHRGAASPQASAGHKPLRAAWEDSGLQLTWCLFALVLGVLPWMAFMPIWASVATGLLAVGCMLLAQAWAVPVLRVGAAGLHAASLVGFVSTVHRGEGDAALANGWTGLGAAVLVGASLLTSAWLGLRDTWRQALATARPPVWPLATSIGIVLGVGLLSASLLFTMTVETAALVWPFIGVLLLWAGLRLAHPTLCGLWAALNLGSVAAFMTAHPAAPMALDAQKAVPWQATLAIMGGLAWWTPLVLTVSAVMSGAWLSMAARPEQRWRMGWVASPLVQMGIVAYALCWWVQTLLPELWLHLAALDLAAWWPAALALCVTATSMGMVRLAHWRHWGLMGQASALAIPGWWLIALSASLLWDAPPLAELGWLAWPLALAWHLRLLHHAGGWWPAAWLRWWHVTGFWLFAGLATHQMGWGVQQWVPPDSAWASLGWVVIPVALIAGMAKGSLRQRWPVRDFLDSYLLMGGLPLVLMMLWWLLESFFHAGSPAPLPYVPLLNPLEVGQGLVMAALAMWAGALPGAMRASVPQRWGVALLGALAFTLLSTIVLRTCHHWAGVPWDAPALFHSKLTQAALSVTWALVGVALMLTGHRRVRRMVWLAGAALLAVVVGKLFFIELADRGGLYRIVSFIAVGVLLLVVGYFAPVPPERQAAGGAKAPGAP